MFMISATRVTAQTVPNVIHRNLRDNPRASHRTVLFEHVVLPFGCDNQMHFWVDQNMKHKLTCNVPCSHMWAKIYGSTHSAFDCREHYVRATFQIEPEKSDLRCAKPLVLCFCLTRKGKFLKLPLASGSNQVLQLGPSVVPFYPFWGRVPLLK